MEHLSLPAQAVAFARSTEEVVGVVRVCRESRTPLIPFGTGTSLEGHIQASEGGVCLDLSEMNRVLCVNEEDMDCRGETRRGREREWFVGRMEEGGRSVGGGGEIELLKWGEGQGLTWTAAVRASKEA